MAAEDDEKKRERRGIRAQCWPTPCSRQLLPRQIMTRKAFENAIAVVMAIGGSTNAVLHLLAIARAARVPLALDDFETIRKRVPVLCDLKPSGKYVDHGTACGRRHSASDEDSARARRAARRRPHHHRQDRRRNAGQRSQPSRGRIRTSFIRGNKPVAPEGHLVILKGNLAPEGAVAKISKIRKDHRPGARLRFRRGVPGGHSLEANTVPAT